MLHLASVLFDILSPCANAYVRRELSGEVLKQFELIIYLPSK